MGVSSLCCNILTLIVDEKEEYINFLKEQSEIDKEKIESVNKIIDSLDKVIKENAEEFDVHATLIGSLISNLLLFNDRGSVIITKKGNEFEVNYFTYKMLNDFEIKYAKSGEIDSLIRPLLESPHIQIPIRKLMEDFFDDPKSEKYVDSFGLLNLKEKKVIDALRKKEFKQIIIKQDSEKKTITIEVEQDGEILDQKAKEVKRILGLNEYSEVTIKYRNDKHLYFKNKSRL